MEIPTEENNGELFWFNGEVWDSQGIFCVKIVRMCNCLCGLIHGGAFPVPISNFHGKWKKIKIKDIEWD